MRPTKRARRLTGIREPTRPRTGSSTSTVVSFDAHPQTVVRHLVRAGVELRRLGLTDEQATAAVKSYREGMTVVEIGAGFDVAASAVRRYLLVRGVLLRPAGRWRLAPA